MSLLSEESSLLSPLCCVQRCGFRFLMVCKRRRESGLQKEERERM